MHEPYFSHANTHSRQNSKANIAVNKDNEILPSIKTGNSTRVIVQKVKRTDNEGKSFMVSIGKYFRDTVLHDVIAKYNFRGYGANKAFQEEALGILS